MTNPKPKLRWSFEGIATLGNTVVGCVCLSASGGWIAHGFMAEWQDAPLGTFKTNFQARRAVARWVKGNQ